MLQEERPTRDGNDIRADVEALKGDIAALRRDLAALVQDLVAAGKAEAGEAFTNAARSRLDECGVDMDQLLAQGREVKESLREKVERHPLMSIGIALGTGMVLGSIFRRR